MTSRIPGSRRFVPRLEGLDDRIVPALFAVTTGADDGPGSLRAALDAASANDTIDTIVVRPSVGAITIESTLTYTGAEFLTIKGNWAAVRPAAGGEGEFDLFEATGGGGLSLEGLTFENGRKGVEVVVPAGRTGVLSVELNRVTVRDNVEHGLHVNDLVNGTEASVYLSVSNSTIVWNGTDPDDFDGIRVDERGAGDIRAWFFNTTVAANGGDGVELDEDGEGDVRIYLTSSRFLFNGNANLDDLEDGFDVDEAGGGSVIGQVIGSTFDHNFQGGLDVNEAGAGDLTLSLALVRANDNGDSGIEYSEEDDGGVLATFRGVEASRNDAAGIAIAESGGGDLDAAFANCAAFDNADEGIDLDEADAGDLRVLLFHVRSNTPLDLT